MLNLKQPFTDAVNAFEKGREQLQVFPLASVVYLMQRDVINHYQHALKHYLTVDLAAPFLQHSSLGTPYQKWAKFTNDDFDMLFFAIRNLLRYTARLLDEMTVERPFEKEPSRRKRLTAPYISWLVDMRLGRLFVGVRCEQSHRLSIMPLPVPPPPPGTAYEPKSLAIESQSARKEILQRVQADGLAELSSLQATHEHYSSLCRQYYGKHDVIRPFEALHESYYV